MSHLFRISKLCSNETEYILVFLYSFSITLAHIPRNVGVIGRPIKDLRDATFYQGGSMMILVYAADVLLYLSGTSFLLTASLYSPPIIERPPVKITQVA